MLLGDFVDQLPPVMDLPLYNTVSRNAKSDLGSSTAYQMFDYAVILEQPMHRSGEDPDRLLFRNILYYFDCFPRSMFGSAVVVKV